MGEIKHRCAKVCECGDALHFYSATLLHILIENTRGVNDMPARVLVVSMTNKQIICSECVRLYPNVRLIDFIDGRTLTDVLIAGDNQGAGRWSRGGG